MSIRVDPEAVDLVSEGTGRFVLLVTDADDADLAFAGLDAARARLVPLGPGLLSPVVQSPAGPLLLVADLPAEEDVLAGIPDLVATCLAEAGVGEALVTTSDTTGPLDQLDRTSGAVVLRVFPVPAGPAGVLPTPWLEVAAEWVLGDLLPADEVQLRLLGAPFAVAAADAPASLYAAAGARAWCDLVQGDLRDRIRSASLTFGHAPHLALAAGGPSCDGGALLARYELLCDVARELADGVAYACVDLEPTFELLGLGLTGAGWPEQGGARPNAVASLIGDVAVPDAFPFQVLGPGHAERLAQLGRGPLGVPLGDGRTELELGDPIDWLPMYEARDEVLEQGTKALEGLLVTEAELAELAEARPLRPPLPARTPTPRGGLDLDDITLEAQPHPRRGLRLTLLELVSWVAHEHHSDTPASVSPVLAAYARWLSAGLDHARRQELKPYAALLAGTRTPGLPRGSWRPMAEVDERRAWQAADWLARHQAALWLDAAGLHELAGALVEVQPEADRSHLARTVDLLDRGLVELVARRPSASGEDRAWEAWERAAEATGWVAASEAAWVGVPEGLASATELRVVELVRDRRTSRGLQPGVAAGAARDAGRTAAAEAAWRGAGRAAAQVVDAMADDPDAPAAVLPVSLATARERAGQGVAGRLGIDRDTLDVALEQADQAARECLAGMVGAAARAHPYDQARAAAGASAGGTEWEAVEEMAAAMFGEEAWETSLAAARTAVGRVLHHAEPLLDRAVLIALAREASGVAARVLAATEGPAAFEVVVDDLRTDAVDLLDRLLAIR